MMSDQYKRELAAPAKAAATLRTQNGQQETAAGKARADPKARLHGLAQLTKGLAAIAKKAKR